ncbi:MAG: Outer membrane protein OprM [Chlamydiae bacterium]|nr:Outer membrane protein OprM [Chlamydiota bacterium]
MGDLRQIFIHLSIPATVCTILLLTSCTYPFASISSRKVMPSSLGKTWTPPKRSIKTTRKIHSEETIDPAIYEGDISLSQSIDFALKNNPDTSISWAGLQSSIARLGLAREDFFPTIDTSGYINRRRTGFTFPPDILIVQWLTTWAPQLNVNYTIWDFGARNAKSEGALQALFAMAWSYNQEIQNVVQLITNDYYEDLYQKATLENDKQNVKDSLLILDAAQKKLKVGVGDITQLVQAKTNYLQMEVELVDQRDSAAISRIKLAKDMGMPGNVEFTTQNFPSDLPGSSFITNLNELIDVAIEQRPDILKSKSSVKSKKAALTEARLNSLPKVDGSLELDYSNYNNYYKSTVNYKGQFSINFPFFAGFHYRNKIREAKAKYNQAIAELKKQQDIILQQVTVYFTNYQNAIDRVELSASFLDSALEEFDVTLSNYRAGTGDIIDVMQAQTSLTDARTKYTVSVKDLFVSLTNLAYSTGSLVAPTDNSQWDSIYQFRGSYEN